jgi:hypothetical protein
MDNQAIIQAEPFEHLLVSQTERRRFNEKISESHEFVVNPILGHDQTSPTVAPINASTSDSRQQVVRAPNLIGEGNFPSATPAHQELLEIGK